MRSKAAWLRWGLSTGSLLVLMTLSGVARAVPADEDWVPRVIKVETAAQVEVTVPVILAGAEGPAQALLAPLVEEKGLRDGWRLDGIQLGTYIILNVSHATSGETDQLAIYPRAWLDGMVCDAAGLGIVVRHDTGALASSARLLCETMTGRSAEGVFSTAVLGGLGEKTPKAGAASRELQDLKHQTVSALTVALHNETLTRILFVLLIALVTLALRRSWREDPPEVRERWFVLALVLMSALLRALLPEFTVLKEAYPFRGFDSVAAPLVTGRGTAEIGLPVLHYAVVNLLYHLIPGLHVDEAMRWMTLLLASLTPLVAYLGLRLWTPASRAPLLTAVALTFLPAHVKYSASEALTVSAVFYLSVSFLALGLVLRKGGALAWGALTLSLWFLFQVRPENPLYYPLIPTALYLLAWGRRAERARIAALGALLGGISLIPVVVTLLGGGPASGALWSVLEILPRALQRFFSGHNIFWDPRFTPLLYQAAALAGVVTLLITRRAVAWLLLLAFALPFVAYGAFTSDVIPFGECRYQVAMSLPFAALAGYGAESLWRVRALSPRVRAALPGVVTALAALALLLSLGFVRGEDFNPQAEYRFFVEEARPLIEADAGCGVFVVPGGDQRFKDEDAGGFAVILHKDDLQIVDVAQLDGVTATCALFFRGLYCYRAHGMEARENPYCGQLMGQPGLEPLAEAKVPNRPYHRERASFLESYDELTYGLYRIPLPLKPVE